MIGRYIPALVLLTVCSVPASLSQTDSGNHLSQGQVEPAPALIPGKAAEGQFAAGQGGRYTVSLAAGVYCRLSLPAGENVAVAAYTPSGEECGRFASDDAGAYHHISILAEQSGLYTFKINVDLESRPGSYRVLLDEVRQATENDRNAAAAAKSYAAAQKLAQKVTKESNLEAISTYKQALDLWTADKDDEGRAAAMLQMGLLRYRMGNAKDALQDLAPALTIAQALGSKRLESRLLEQIGSCYVRLSDYQKALDFLNESLAAARLAGDRSLEAAALDSTGLTYYHQSQYTKALDCYSRVLTLYRALGDRGAEGQALSDAGLAYYGLSQYEKALDYYKQALPISESAGDRPQVARVLNNTGLTYYSLSEYNTALEYFNRSLPIRREVGDRTGEAITLSNMGLVYRAIAQYEKAVECYSQALPILHEIGNRAAEAVTLSNTGVAYAKLGQIEKALDCFNRSLPVSHEVGNKAQEASTLNNLGLVYSEIRQEEKALGYYTQSLTIQRAIGDKMQESGTLDNIGVIYKRLGQTDKALDYYNQSLAISRALQNRVDECLALANIGFLYASLGQYQKAQEFYSLALPISRKIADRFGESRTLEGMAEVYRAAGDFAQARSAIEQSIAISESVRSEVSNDQSRSLYFASARARFDFYISLLLETYNKQPDPSLISAALEASERSRARSLLDLIAVSRVDINQGVDPALKAREQAIYARISRLQSNLIRANARTAPDANKISALEGQLAKADDERQQIEIKLRRSSPRYAALKYPAPLTAQSIQKLLDPDTVLLEYSLGGGQSFLFAVTGSEVRVKRLCAENEIRASVEQLRSSITSPGRAGFSNYLASASELYHQLVEPAADMLAGKKRLVIIPDGELYYVPYEALIGKPPSQLAGVPPSELPYLIRDFAVTYAPSASVLGMLGRDSEASINNEWPRQFIAFADPDYGVAAESSPGSLDSVVRGTFGAAGLWKLQGLPASRTEVEKIASLFPAGSSTLFEGAQATEENAKAPGRLGQYRFVHFAVHGLVDESQPQFSSLVLSLPKTEAGGASKPGEDGLLQAFEIFNLKLKADLVTLSACETGLGKEVKGEGLIGLSRAFFYAGAPSLLVSIWKVDDRSTADLMESFYRSLITGPKPVNAANNAAASGPRSKSCASNKAEALRQAKLKLIGSGTHSHPYYWAPFILTGKP